MSAAETMAIGPVQLVVLGFEKPNFRGEVVHELERLRETDAIRVIDALEVHKDALGNIEVAHLSTLTRAEAAELGSKVGALVGLGIDGEEVAAGGQVEVAGDEEAWDVVGDIPNDSVAALVLIEHHWAVPLRDAIARRGGFCAGDGFVAPAGLASIGLLPADAVSGYDPRPGG